MIKPIAPILLVAEAPGEHTPALQRGFDLARRSGAAIHVVLFGHDPLIERSGTLVHPDVMRRAQRQFLDERRAWLDTLATRWTADGLQVTTEAVWAPLPHEAILGKALELRPTVVIKDVGHEKRVQRLLHRALDWKVLRTCPAPLMLVHSRSGHLPERVLAAVDTSTAVPNGAALNELIMREAVRYADYGGAPPHLAHVFPFPHLEEVPYPTLENIYAQIEGADHESFDAFARSHRVPDAARHWLLGEPAAQLAALVREGVYDLLVIGSVYRKALDRLFLGSTSEALLQDIPCDVLLVRPPAFMAELAAHVDLHALRNRLGRIAGGEPVEAAIG